MTSPEHMGRQFSGLHHAPQPAGSEWTPEYTGQTLYHGSPHLITDGVIKPNGGDGRAWATSHPDDASRYGSYKDGEKPIHLYEVKPIDANEVVGVYGSKVTRDGMVKHFHSGKGFTVVRKVEQ
jgi:hypothetical protein